MYVCVGLSRPPARRPSSHPPPPWLPLQPLNKLIKYYVLPSDTTRHESAWVDFQVVGDCADEERAVLFPPYSEDVALWVYHPEAAKVRSARARAGTVGALTQVALRSCEGRTRR